MRHILYWSKWVNRASDLHCLFFFHRKLFQKCALFFNFSWKNMQKILPSSTPWFNSLPVVFGNENCIVLEFANAATRSHSISVSAPSLSAKLLCSVASISFSLIGWISSSEVLTTSTPSTKGMDSIRAARSKKRIAFFFKQGKIPDVFWQSSKTLMMNDAPKSSLAATVVTTTDSRSSLNILSVNWVVFRKILTDDGRHHRYIKARKLDWGALQNEWKIAVCVAKRKMVVVRGRDENLAFCGCGMLTGKITAKIG